MKKCDFKLRHLAGNQFVCNKCDESVIQIFPPDVTDQINVNELAPGTKVGTFCRTELFKESQPKTQLNFGHILIN